MNKKIYFLIASCILGMPNMFAGDGAYPILAGNQKFVAVIVVLSIIFIGIATYLFILDKKISRMEKKDK